MTFIKSLIHKILNKEISNIYNKRFDTFNNTPKGVFWNSKLSQDLRLNIILDKILQNAKSDEFSIADIGCGYGRLYEIIRERKLDEKVAELHLAKVGATLTKLSDEQASYIGISSESAFKSDEYRY